MFDKKMIRRGSGKITRETPTLSSAEAAARLADYTGAQGTSTGSSASSCRTKFGATTTPGSSPSPSPGSPDGDDAFLLAASDQLVSGVRNMSTASPVPSAARGDTHKEPVKVKNSVAISDRVVCLEEKLIGALCCTCSGFFNT